MERKIKWSLGFLMLLLVMSSCEDEFYLPKPKSYFRIDLPEKFFEKTEILELPLSVNLAKYSVVEPKNKFGQFNIFYPIIGARIHCSYFDLKGKELHRFVEDCYKMAYEHNVKASAITTNYFNIDSLNVYGTMYELKGNAASPIQFYMTDSTNHFLRGSLYFETKTNADSLAPVKAYIKEDIEELFNSLTWKE